MAKKERFKLVNKYMNAPGILCFDIELHDADDSVTKYLVTDYYSADGRDIVETTIEKLGEYIEGSEQVPAETDEDINENSYLGKKIIEYLEGTEDYHQIPA